MKNKKEKYKQSKRIKHLLKKSYYYSKKRKRNIGIKIMLLIDIIIKSKGKLSEIL